MQRSEERCCSWQIALGLCDTRLECNGTNVVRCDIKNLIKLPQCFREATKSHIRNGVLGEEVRIARVEPHGFVEVRFAPLPLATPSCDVGQRFWNAAVIRQDLTCLLKITYRRVVILQATVVVIALS